jgi:ATP-dependent DNA helicase DinG
MLQGRANYLSLSRLAEELEDAFEEESLPAPQAWLLAALVRFAEASHSGNLVELGYIPQSLDEFLHAEGGVLQALDTLRCSEDDRGAHGLPDFYRRARDNAGRADLVVINHALLFDEVLEGEKEPFASRVVCDEAHTLEDAATLALQASVSERALRRLLRALHDPGRRSGLTAACRKSCGMAADDQLVRDLVDNVGSAHAALDSLADRLYAYAAAQTVVSRQELERFGVRVRIGVSALSAAGGPALRAAAEAAKRALSDLRLILDALLDAISVDLQTHRPDRRLRRQRRVVRLARSLLRDLAKIERTFQWFWSFDEASRYVRVVELQSTEGKKGERGPVALYGVPINVGPLLWQQVWSRLDCLICTSATLTVFGQGFDFFLERIGLEPSRVEGAARQLLTRELPPAFDYHNSALLMLPSDLPAPRDSDLKFNFPTAVAALLERFIPFFCGRSLVLFTANSRRDMVYEQLAPVLSEQGYRVFCQGRGSLSQLIDDFREDPASSLLGSRSLWEGVDVPGESLSYVFLEKLPYASAGDPVEAARMNAVDAAGGDPFYDYLLPKMVILLKQGFGRLIRHTTDRGVAILLDKRLRNAMYRAEVFRSLPDPTVGYESGVDLFRTVAEWMGLDFDPEDLPAPTVTDLARVLDENRLSHIYVSEDEFETLAKTRLLAVQKAV